MSDNALHWSRRPKLNNATMLLAFSGWMDGGDVSTGTISRLIKHLDAKRFAHVDPHGYYIDSFPGGMEVTALFRPQVKIKDGLIKSFTMPPNRFYLAEECNLVLFRGKEPNLRWREFGQHVFDVAAQVGVSRLIFVGSFAGAVPHTREPRLHMTVSDPKLKDVYTPFGIRFTTYEGPASFASYLLTKARSNGLEMVSLVAEIPAYIEGTNPPSIEAVTRRLSAILQLPIDLSSFRNVSDEWESRVSEEVEKNEELAEQIRKLERSYDDDLLDTPIAKQWLGDDGISLD